MSGPKVKITPEIIYNQDFFEKWVQDMLSGEYGMADDIVQQAIMLVEDFQEGGHEPIYAMLTLLKAFYLVAASCDMQTDKLQELIEDNANLMWDSARFLIQHQRNEMEKAREKGYTGEIIH